MTYIPIYRNEELAFVKHFFEEEIEDVKDFAFTSYNSYDVICGCLFWLFNLSNNNELSGEEKWLFIEGVLGETGTVERERRESGTSLDSNESFISIFDPKSANGSVLTSVVWGTSFENELGVIFCSSVDKKKRDIY